ncbi:MAG: precorrin-6y C5,15-methyltransferase (decarboxylating) subunit CbiE [Alphaproteobacteria bacterium]
MSVDVIGIGADGIGGLRPEVRALLDAAEVIVGGERHLGFVGDHGATKIPWRRPLEATFEDLEPHLDRRIVVLSSGDPLDHGVARRLFERFGSERVAVHPHPSAFALACARLGWSRDEVTCLSLHARPLARLKRELVPGRRLLLLTDAKTSASAIAAALRETGWGPSRVWRLSRLGAPDEILAEGIARDWSDPTITELDTVAVACVPDPTAPPIVGFTLADDAFLHDGQLSKAQARMHALFALHPLPGQHLWDVGAGTGGIAITWLRAAGEGQVTAIETDYERAALLQKNADRLGTPEVQVCIADAPEVYDELDDPDVVFVGGGCHDPAVLEGAWERLPAGGRLVAQAVTCEGQTVLSAMAEKLGGTLTRFHRETKAPLGGKSTWRPSLPVLQLEAVKP